MKVVQFKNAAKELTLEQAIKAYEAGIAVIVNDGKDVTLEIEKRAYARQQIGLKRYIYMIISQRRIKVNGEGCKQKRRNIND